MYLTQLNIFNLFSSSSLYSSLLLILIILSIWWELTFCCEDFSKKTLEQLIFILLLFPCLPLAVLGFFYLFVCFKAQDLFSSPLRPLASFSLSALILEPHWIFPTLGLHKQKGNVWFESQGGKSCSDVPQSRNWGHDVVYRTHPQRD